MDRYRYELFHSIRSADVWEWGPFLSGHINRSEKKEIVADHIYEGVLTEDPNTIFHSCHSKGVCPVRDGANVVQIIPVTTRKIVPAYEKSQVDRPDPGDHRESFSRSAGTLKRKHIEDIQHGPDPKRAKDVIVKELGHTLLEPRQSWWGAEETKERLPIVSASGERLPYYIVCPLLT